MGHLGFFLSLPGCSRQRTTHWFCLEATAKCLRAIACTGREHGGPRAFSAWGVGGWWLHVLSHQPTAPRHLQNRGGPVGNPTPETPPAASLPGFTELGPLGLAPEVCIFTVFPRNREASVPEAARAWGRQQSGVASSATWS